MDHEDPNSSPSVSHPRESDAGSPVRYSVELRPAVRRALRKMDQQIARRLIAALLALATAPRPAGVSALTGTTPPKPRVRVGDYRIVYEVHDDRLVILVVLVGHRRDTYRNL
jgi:mRNA interferase RelE/StbE